MKVFVIEGRNVLGRQVENTVTGIYFNGTLTEEVFAEYALAKQSSELINTTVGIGATFSERKLTDMEKILRKTVKNQMKVAVKTADKELINIVFNKLRGKK